MNAKQKIVTLSALAAYVLSGCGGIGGSGGAPSINIRPQINIGGRKEPTPTPDRRSIFEKGYDAGKRFIFGEPEPTEPYHGAGTGLFHRGPTVTPTPTATATPTPTPLPGTTPSSGGTPGGGSLPRRLIDGIKGFLGAAPTAVSGGIQGVSTAVSGGIQVVQTAAATAREALTAEAAKATPTPRPTPKSSSYKQPDSNSRANVGYSDALRRVYARGPKLLASYVDDNDGTTLKLYDEPVPAKGGKQQPTTRNQRQAEKTYARDRNSKARSYQRAVASYS